MMLIRTRLGHVLVEHFDFRVLFCCFVLFFFMFEEVNPLRNVKKLKKTISGFFSEEFNVYFKTENRNNF